MINCTDLVWAISKSWCFIKSKQTHWRCTRCLAKCRSEDREHSGCYLQVELPVTIQCPCLSMHVESLNILHMLGPDGIKGQIPRPYKCFSSTRYGIWSFWTQPDSWYSTKCHVYRKQALKIANFEHSIGERKCQQRELQWRVEEALTLLPDRAPSNTQGQIEQQELETMRLHTPSKWDT